MLAVVAVHAAGTSAQSTPQLLVGLQRLFGPLTPAYPVSSEAAAAPATNHRVLIWTVPQLGFLHHRPFSSSIFLNSSSLLIFSLRAC